jgi:hypothetical protein
MNFCSNCHNEIRGKEYCIMIFGKLAYEYRDDVFCSEACAKEHQSNVELARVFGFI